ncbi:nucleoside-triphosphatase [Caproiciproducens faecalis]|uniref:NTPase n=1 Tax=Caproiciproducens faecalis TaxID=2820301 RepID=A0ABS7DJP1_9FIRM|nr:nucleoside-triphosphatase [Caproiciproducens faecalis]MBW7571511.1 hypothetical protein [Caproiciproducens faecalis]
MMTVITGDINSGKTTVLINHYKINRQGDGFALPKFSIPGRAAGQKIMRLSTGEKKILSYSNGFEILNPSEAFRYKNYHFTKNGIAFANKIAADIINNNTNPVYLDEIGPVELMKSGFYYIVLAMLDHKKDMFLVVRSTCLEDVLNLFHIHADRIIAL